MTDGQRYRVVRRLGDRVVLAEDEVLRRQVVIKALEAEGSPEAVRRFRREAKLGASLSHPGLVQVLDALGEGDDVQLVMEHVPGPSLEALLADGPLPRARAMAILRDVAAALDHAHGAGVLHRDVRAANVLLGAGGHAKLAGLGLVAAAENASTTVSGLLGKGGALAPELVAGTRATPASDVFAFAALARDVLGDDLPPGAQAVLAQGLAADPAARPGSAKALVDALEAALPAAPASAPDAEPTTTLPPVPVPAPDPHRSRRLAPLAAVVALLLLAAGAGLLLVRPGGSDGPASQDRAAQGTTEEPDAGGSGEEAQDGGTTATTPPAEADAEGSAAGTGDPPAAADPGGPAGAVRAFYERAAAGDFDEAWALASEDLRAAWGGDQDAFAADLRSLERITFDELQVAEQDGDTASVTVATRAEHTTYTDTCTGTIPAVRGPDGWLVGRPGISCRRS